MSSFSGGVTKHLELPLKMPELRQTPHCLILKFFINIINISYYHKINQHIKNFLFHIHSIHLKNSKSKYFSFFIFTLCFTISLQGQSETLQSCINIGVRCRTPIIIFIKFSTIITWT